MRFSTIFFDLDDTLYPPSSGLWHAIKERMNIYMRDVLHIPADEVPALREQYYKMYGTTLRGLIERHNVEEQEFLAFVHDLPLKKYLTPLFHNGSWSLPTQIFTTPDAFSPHSNWTTSSRPSLTSMPSRPTASQTLSPLPLRRTSPMNLIRADV
jgi:hypothetical protein